ncbi:MAG: AI-2E family transporter [Methanotrichaceae archaeon]
MNLRARFYTIATALFIISLISAVYLTKVFLTTFLFSVFMTYLLYPIYAYLLRHTGNKQVASMITIFSASSIILYLVFFVINRLLSEVSGLLSSGGASYIQGSNLSKSIEILMERVLPAPLFSILGIAPESIASSITGVVKENLSGFVPNIPVYLAQLILLVLFTYYLFTDGRGLVSKIFDIIPQKTIVYYFLKELNLIYNIFFRIHFLIAVVSAIIAMIGFFFIGVPYPITWGIILGFFALLPELGPAALFVPMAIYYIIIYDYAKAIEIFIFGEIFLVAFPEYILRPRLVMIGASVHPLLTILAFTAPIFIIGASGVIVGPAVYGLVLAGYRTMAHLEKL